MSSDKPDGTGANKPKTLSDDKIVTSPKVRRRGLLSMVGGALVGAAAVATGFVPSRSHALTDNDSGRNSDPAGAGRGRYTGRTDGDSGRFADSVGGGRGAGVTDNDGGRYADHAGSGRSRYTGVTDTDGGRNADAGGGGRGGYRRSDPADSDVGRYADSVDSD